MSAFIGGYRELGYEGSPSMRDSVSDAPYPEKDVVLAYIKSGGSPHACGTGVNRDALSGEVFGLANQIRGDGDFSWSTTLAHYVDRYNLRLPDEFVARAVEEYGGGA